MSKRSTKDGRRRRDVQRQRLEWYEDMVHKLAEDDETKRVNISELRVKTTHAIYQAWNDLFQEHPGLVRSSFSQSGISKPVDGSKDKEIKIVGAKNIPNFGITTQ